MTKILYGVSGEGSGHSSRARLIAGQLIKNGHDVKLASYDRGYRNLHEDFDVLEIVGLSIASENNEVSKLKTLTDNLAKIPKGTKAIAQLRSCIKEFKPDVIITDFEPCTAYLANHYQLPLISLDNQHRMRYMEYPIPHNLKKDAKLTETIIRAMIPKPWVSLITSFHQGALKNQHSFLFPPILREEILALTTSANGPILVYATGDFPTLLDELKHFHREQFVVYGYNRSERIQNLQLRPFSKTEFLQELANAKAVIATAGFTLMTESLHLNKPYLALPMQGQFEQQLNAQMLDEHGYGMACDSPSQRDIAAFLYSLPDYQEKLRSYPRQGNQAICEFLEELLAEQCRKLQSYRR